jgi:hypothetical protein
VDPVGKPDGPVEELIAGYVLAKLPSLARHHHLPFNVRLLYLTHTCVHDGHLISVLAEFLGQALAMGNDGLDGLTRSLFGKCCDNV